MIFLLILGGLLAGAIIDRAIASSSMTLEEHEEYQHGTDLLFVAMLIVGALAAFALIGLGAQP